MELCRASAGSNITVGIAVAGLATPGLSWIAASAAMTVQPLVISHRPFALREIEGERTGQAPGYPTCSLREKGPLRDFRERTRRGG